jgi:hypothetical protein
MSIHTQVNREGVTTRVVVNREENAVYITLPNGDLRYSSNDVETALRLPLFVEPVAAVKPEPVDHKFDKDKVAAKVEDKKDKDDAKADKLVESK